MENKINLAELLKDCPKGMELDCVLYNDVTFVCVLDGLYPIQIQTPEGSVRISKYGGMSLGAHAKCIIFPKGKNTWEKFQKPFKDGDVVAYDDEEGDTQLFIYKEKIEIEEDGYALCYLTLPSDGRLDLSEGEYSFQRFATEEEKEKLFQVIKDNGYKWNAETKTLEKLIEPKFKVGDRIKKGKKIATIVRIYEKFYDFIYDSGIGSFTIDLQDEWELVPNKFDINTLKPFDKMLVRVTDNDVWIPKFFSYYDADLKAEYYPFIATDDIGYPQCIPYSGNEYLCRTTNNCDEYYKTWE
jgi:hypothetical protein